MTEKPYPTRNGLPVSPLDIWLPQTHLNPEKDKNYNNHHDCWTAKRFGRSVLFQVCRDIESNQIYLPLDVHAWLHETYAPPKMPTPYEAMCEVERAFCDSDKLHIKRDGGYVLRLMDLSTYDRCEQDYNRIMYS